MPQVHPATSLHPTAQHGRVQRQQGVTVLIARFLPLPALGRNPEAELSLLFKLGEQEVREEQGIVVGLELEALEAVEAVITHFGYLFLLLELPKL